MSRVVDALEATGLNSPEQIHAACRDWPLPDILTARDRLAGALQEGKRGGSGGPNSDGGHGLRFYAGYSFRPDCGCVEQGCRAARAKFLARYAALYCEEVILPVRIPQGAPDEPSAQSSFLYDLEGTLLALHEVSAVARSGIVRLVPDSVCLCPDCARAGVPKIRSLLRRAKGELNKARGKFSARLFPTPLAPGATVVELVGPEDYLEHGRMFVVYARRPAWLGSFPGTSRRKGAARLPKQLLEKSRLLDRLFSQLASGVLTQYVYGRDHSAACLTALPAEARVLASLDGHVEREARKSKALSALTHEVPLLAEVPLDRIVKTRQQEPEAFLRYRLALGKVVKECLLESATPSASEARRIYQEVLLPEVARLADAARAVRRRSLRRAAGQAVAWAVAVSIGAAAHLSPSLLPLSAPLLIPGVRDVVDSLDPGRVAGPSADYYFLLKLGVGKSQHGPRRPAKS